MNWKEWEIVQNPPPGMFSSQSLYWSPSSTAIIPWSRVTDFRDGEGRRDKDCEASFYTRTSKNSTSHINDWIEYKIFWCSYGPQDEHTSNAAIPPLPGTTPKVGCGSRPRGRKNQYNNHVKRGYECHFFAKRMKTPDTAQITYVNRKHVNKNGQKVHGTWQKEGDLPSWGPKGTVAPWLSQELTRHLEDLIRSNLNVQSIFDVHCQNQFNREGDDRGHELIDIDRICTFDGRDDLLSKQDLYNLKRKIDKEEWMYDVNDQTSVKKWIDIYPERVLFHKEYIQGPPEQKFILGIQSPSQMAHMIKLSHGSVLAMDSTFAINKYGFPFFTLVAFDCYQMGLPVAWCIQQTESAKQIFTFLQVVKDRALSVKPTWKPSCFIIDCAEAEVSALRKVFPDIPIYFCNWHVRRAWKENLIKKVTNKSLLLDMNDDLGDIMYAESEAHMQSLWQNVKVKHHLQTSFLDYFEETWMHRPEKWMRVVRDMPRANQNTNGAIEAWHSTLKKMMRRVVGDIGARRVDRVITALFHTMLPYFFVQLRRKQLGIAINWKLEEIVVNSLHEAQHSMKDSQVSFDDPEFPNRATIRSLKGEKEYIVRNIYSNFPSCSCKWATKEGNMCKHQLKALLLRGHDGGILVQQLGTRGGTEMGGIHQLEKTTEDDQDVLLLQGEPEDETFPSEEPEPETQPDIQEAQVLAIKRKEDGLKEDLSKIVQDMFSAIEGHEDLTEMALHCWTIGFNKVIAHKQTKALSGKDRVSTNDAFLWPAQLTSKRRLGVVDLYHRGLRGKRVQSRRKTAASHAEDKGEDTEKQPDKLPNKRKTTRESFRQHLNRLGVEFEDGRKRRKSANSQGTTRPVPSRNLSLGGADREMDLNIDLDLNVPEKAPSE